MAERVVQMAYGRQRLPLVLDEGLAAWRVVAPREEAALPEPHEAFRAACRAPIASKPLRALVKPSDNVVVVTSDGTRPVPNEVLLPWLLEELPVPPERVTVLLGTGTHRPNAQAEIAAMFGADLARTLRIVNHDAFDPEANEHVGVTAAGVPVRLDKWYVQAAKRIALGFIEPHFFAGFSGGPKAVAPGVASIETILALHGYD
ncbi:MAG TPA: DUF2088 domain-containing protein, partial [Candidatus Hydrogenedentes bacterium]|nr:DUF2088 domain-containing protein [Candidatus Hydrogenedentota bacterium]